MANGGVKVFVVDDSALVRAMFRSRLHGVGELVVVGEASSGEEALAMIPHRDPDLVLMDVMMSGMDGVLTTEELMAIHPKPILVVSERARRDGELGFRLLEAGALDVVAKPTMRELREAVTRDAFIRRIRMLASVPVVTRHRRRGQATRVWPEVRAETRRAELVCIGASTGGPPALLELLRSLPDDATCPVLVVQHMADGFIEGMRSWIAAMTGRRVILPRHGAMLEPGAVHLAPDDVHMTLRGRAIELGARGPAGHRPSIDALFESVATSGCAPGTLAILLTGMGADGARGLLSLRRAGARTIAQDRTTSVVYGMPRAAVELGAAAEVLPLDAIAMRLRDACARRADSAD